MHASALLGVAHALLEQRQPKGTVRAAGGARVLPGDHVVLRMGHQAEDDATRVAHTGDVVDGSIGVAAAVGQGDLAAISQRLRIGMGVAPLAVGDRTIDRVDVGGPYATTGCRVEADPFALEVPA